MAVKKVIVTGGAGFIGSHTVVELGAAGYEPIVIDNFCNSDRKVLRGLEAILKKPIRCHEIDCNDSQALAHVFEREGEIFGVIHFAAYKSVSESVARPLEYYRNNVGSLLTLLDRMCSSDVHNLVFSSSCTVYGQPDALPVTEETPRKPAESPYGATKQVCEWIIEDVVKAGDLIRAVTLRYFNPIGAHPSGLIGELPLGTPDNLVPFITQTAAGVRQRLTVFGDDYATQDGSCIRDYIHVMDLANAHVKALDWLEAQPRVSGNEVFNVGTGKGCSVFEAIQAFERAAGVTLPYTVGSRRPGDIEQIFADADKAQRVLGWKAQRSIEDAMCDAWRWQKNLSA